MRERDGSSCKPDRMRNNHEGKENHLLELCSGHSQMWVFVTALPQQPRLRQQQRFPVNSIWGKTSSLPTAGHCNSPFPVGLIPLGDAPAPGILCAIQPSWAIQPPMLPGNQNFLQIKLTQAAYLFFSPGAQLSLGSLSLQNQNASGKNVYKCCLLFDRRVQFQSLPFHRIMEPQRLKKIQIKSKH